ncbi:MAG: VanZ like family protein [Firmicutes bacterium ADurb.Bin300]|nr:MAG: VanZ like family protein [Firmicutes bacterium ADurb.Bin300]
MRFQPKKKRFKKIVLWMMTVICFITIFILSSQPAENSNSLSKGIVDKSSEVARQIAPSASETPLAKKIFTNKFFREAAHVIIFSFLALFLTLSLREQQVKLSFVLSGLICVLYAILDEAYQSYFIVGRDFEFVDLIKDWCGSIIVVLIVATAVHIAENMKRKKKEA